MFGSMWGKIRKFQSSEEKEKCPFKAKDFCFIIFQTLKTVPGLGYQVDKFQNRLLLLIARGIQNVRKSLQNVVILSKYKKIDSPKQKP